MLLHDLAIFFKFTSCWMNGVLQIKIKWFIRMLKIRNGSSLTAMKTLTFFKTLKYVYIYPVAIKGIFFSISFVIFCMCRSGFFLLSITSIIRNFIHLQFAAIQNNLTIYSCNNWALYLFFLKLKKRIFVTNKIICKVKIKALCDICTNSSPLVSA